MTPEQFIDHWFRQHFYHEWICGDTKLSIQQAANAAAAYHEYKAQQENA